MLVKEGLLSSLVLVLLLSSCEVNYEVAKSVASTRCADRRWTLQHSSPFYRKSKWSAMSGSGWCRLDVWGTGYKPFIFIWLLSIWLNSSKSSNRFWDACRQRALIAFKDFIYGPVKKPNFVSAHFKKPQRYRHVIVAEGFYRHARLDKLTE